MTKLHLSFRVFFDAIRVHAWLVSAILHKVEEVDLCLFAGEPFILPHMVFISKSLTDSLDIPAGSFNKKYL